MAVFFDIIGKIEGAVAVGRAIRNIARLEARVVATLELTLRRDGKREPVRFEARRIVNAGFTGWDQVAATAGGKRTLYQEGRLGELMTPADLIALVRDRADGDLAGTVIYSGTLALLEGQLICGERFEVELSMNGGDGSSAATIGSTR